MPRAKRFLHIGLPVARKKTPARKRVKAVSGKIIELPNISRKCEMTLGKPLQRRLVSPRGMTELRSYRYMMPIPKGWSEVLPPERLENGRVVVLVSSDGFEKVVVHENPQFPMTEVETDWDKKRAPDRKCLVDNP